MCLDTRKKYVLKINTHSTVSEPGSEYSVTGKHVRQMGRQQHRLGCGKQFLREKCSVSSENQLQGKNWSGYHL